MRCHVHTMVSNYHWIQLSGSRQSLQVRSITTQRCRLSIMQHTPRVGWKFGKIPISPTTRPSPLRVDYATKSTNETTQRAICLRNRSFKSIAPSQSTADPLGNIIVFRCNKLNTSMVIRLLIYYQLVKPIKIDHHHNRQWCGGSLPSDQR